VIIGEGDAKEPTDSTFVTVEIAGRPGAYEPERKVKIIATRRARTAKSNTVIARRTVGIGIIGKKGKWVAPLWLYNTGTEPITLTVKLLGQHPSSTVVKRIPFAAGE
jgi:hypothetical protein